MDFLNKLWAALDPVLPGLVAAAIFLAVISIARFKFRGDSLGGRLKNPARIFFLYIVLFALALLAKIYWPAVYKFLYLLSLFILSLAIVVSISVVVFDIFLGRYRKVSVPAILRDIIIIFVYSLLVIVVLGQAGVNVTSIVATSAVLTAVIGFALQDLLSSLLSGLAIQLEKPFKVGHWVQFDEQVGKIMELNWRSTKIQTLHRDIVIIPNNLITRSAVINFSVPTRVHRRKITIGMRYEAPPNYVRASIMRALDGVDGVLKDPAPFIGLESYDAYSILYKIYFFIEDFKRKEIIASDVRTRMWYQFRRDGLSIPFPIRDLNVRNIPMNEKEMAVEEKRSEIRAVLDRVPFLEPLSSEELDTLTEEVTSEFYAEGEPVIRQGEDGSCFYIVGSGEVEVMVSSEPGGANKRVGVLGRYDYFGEHSLMTGERRSATIMAAKDTELYVIDKQAFSKIISANENLIEAIGRNLAKRRKMREVSEGVSQDDVKDTVQEDHKSLISKIKKFFSFEAQ